ncbi:MAG: transglycosylase SLT domain-containing protein, partial [Alphaproteobacteria bacterium]|nr:transglycosylase SLT domain-containing protein [Alphaproteobacteria bacterium]
MLHAALAALFAFAPLPALASGPFALTFKDPATVCATETARQEQALGIPRHLLKAISIVESGRFDKVQKASFAWPWTVTAEGKGRFLPSKAAAIGEVLALRARGVRNIDVGCMQINLHFHPDAFADLNEAFEPAANVAYGAKFLKRLYGETDTWMRAASHYHSQTPELGTAYAGRVTRAWNETR